MPLTLILNVGEDSILLETRNLILRAAGYIVESALSVRQAIDQFRAGDFDLLLLCHSISEKDRDRLTCLIRASGSRIPILAISNGPIRNNGFVDANIGARPAELVEGIEKLLTQSMQAVVKGNPASSQGVDSRHMGNGRRRKTVLCIDDDSNLLVIRSRLLQAAGYFVLTATNASTGLKIFSAGVADAVILDYAMPLMNGGTVAAQMRRIMPSVPLILLSGCAEIPEEDLFLFDCFISKGHSPNALLSALEKLFYASQKKPMQSSASRIEPAVPNGKMALAG